MYQEEDVLAGGVSLSSSSLATAAVSVLDFMEQSPHVCRLIQAILAATAGGTNASAYSSLTPAPATLAPSSGSSRSASLLVCESHLRWLGIDWRHLWRRRFVPRLHAHQLRIVHPMLFAQLWALAADMDRGMQVTQIADLIGGVRSGDEGARETTPGNEHTRDKGQTGL